MQGKRKEQTKFSTKMVAFSFTGIILIMLILTVLASTFPAELEDETMYGPPYKNCTPKQIDIIIQEMVDEMEVHWDTVNKETIDWTGTTNDEDVMWIGGNGDTIWEQQG